MDNISEYLTVNEVAAKLDLSAFSVRKFIRDKHLRAVKIGQWRVRPEDLEAFIKVRQNY